MTNQEIQDLVKRAENLFKSVNSAAALANLAGFAQMADNNLPDGSNLMYMLPYILKLQNDKEKMYGRSWKKYDDISAFMNLARKWDRVENIMKKVMKEGTDSSVLSTSSSSATETFIDTLVDLGVYALMWAGYRADVSPCTWSQFIKHNNLGDVNPITNWLSNPEDKDDKMDLTKLSVEELEAKEYPEVP